MNADDKVLCRNPDPAKAGVRLPVWKFETVRRAILDELANGPVLLSALTDRIRVRIPPDDLEKLGKLGWHMMGVKLELEVRGEIRRLPGVPQRLALGSAE